MHYRGEDLPVLSGPPGHQRPTPQWLCLISGRETGQMAESPGSGIRWPEIESDLTLPGYVILSNSPNLWCLSFPICSWTNSLTHRVPVRSQPNHLHEIHRQCVAHAECSLNARLRLSCVCPALTVGGRQRLSSTSQRSQSGQVNSLGSHKWSAVSRD